MRREDKTIINVSLLYYTIASKNIFISHIQLMIISRRTYIGPFSKTLVAARINRVSGGVYEQHVLRIQKVHPIQ